VATGAYRRRKLRPFSPYRYPRESSRRARKRLAKIAEPNGRATVIFRVPMGLAHLDTTTGPRAVLGSQRVRMEGWPGLHVTRTFCFLVAASPLGHRVLIVAVSRWAQSFNSPFHCQANCCLTVACNSLINLLSLWSLRGCLRAKLLHSTVYRKHYSDTSSCPSQTNMQSAHPLPPKLATKAPFGFRPSDFLSDLRASEFQAISRHSARNQGERLDTTIRTASRKCFVARQQKKAVRLTASA